MPNITILVNDPGSPDARTLIAQLDAYQTNLFPQESNHLLSLESLRQPNVTFLIAQVDDRMAGCGAFVDQDRAYAEIKRMFVLPEFRGLGLGRRILEELEALAQASGLPIMRLETGVSQDEALGLYERLGYQRRGPFGDYPLDPLSVFMEKTLA